MNFYRPLGGSRVGDARFAGNLVLTWMLIGLWHGAAWNFVLWGLWNGIVLAIYAVGMRRKRWALPAFPGKLFCGWLLIGVHALSFWHYREDFWHTGRTCSSACAGRAASR